MQAKYVLVHGESARNMLGQTREEQIIQRLTIIDQYAFQHMVDHLLYQGAFPEIAAEGALVGQFGINIIKRRTIRSAPRPDAEIRLEDLAIECSVDEKWPAKLRKDVEKNRGKHFGKFAFFTNQDVGNGQITIDGKALDAVAYCNAELKCDESWVVGLKDIELPMLNPKFFNIRRNFLNIDEDYFRSTGTYTKILDNPTLRCVTNPADLGRYAAILRDRISFDPSSVILVHNHDYMTLLHAVGIWASDVMKEDSDEFDVCFIRWPYRKIDTSRIDGSEISNLTQTFLVIWGADEIENLADFRSFAAKNVTLMLVTNTDLKENLRTRLEPLLRTMRVDEVSIQEIDERIAEPGERKKHQEKIEVIAKGLVELMLKFEALLYFYSPFTLDDGEKINRVMKVLQINEGSVSHLRELLVDNDLAAITGRIIWLKQPVVAKDLLNDFIDNGAILIDDLMAE